jgi:hypothetical protein
LFSGTARENGSYGSGPNGFTACNIGVGVGCTAINYVNPAAFKQPTNVSTAINTDNNTYITNQYLIGNIPRSQPLNLRNPSTQNFNASIQRTFPIAERVVFIFQADCTIVWNKVTFNGPNTSWGQSTAVTPIPPTGNDHVSGHIRPGYWSQRKHARLAVLRAYQFLTRWCNS